MQPSPSHALAARTSAVLDPGPRSEDVRQPARATAAHACPRGPGRQDRRCAGGAPGPARDPTSAPTWTRRHRHASPAGESEVRVRHARPTCASDMINLGPCGPRDPLPACEMQAFAGHLLSGTAISSIQRTIGLPAPSPDGRMRNTVICRAALLAAGKYRGGRLTECRVRTTYSLLHTMVAQRCA